MENKTIGYCVRCKAKREIKDPEIVEMKSKGDSVRRAYRGICPVCGTKMFRFLPKENVSDSTTVETPTGKSTTTDIEKEMEGFDEGIQ